MYFSSLLTSFALAAGALALPTSSNYMVHERRNLGGSWTPRDGLKPDGSIRLPVRIGLTQSNLDQGEDILMGVSDPKSSSFGKHWSMEEVSRFLFLFIR